MITVEKDIPFTPFLPGAEAARQAGFYPRKWPWHTMSPGDSFTVTTYRVMHSARRSFSSHQSTVNTKLPPSWFVAIKKLSGTRSDGVYRLWLLDKNNPGPLWRPKPSKRFKKN